MTAEATIITIPLEPLRRAWEIALAFVLVFAAFAATFSSLGSFSRAGACRTKLRMKLITFGLDVALRVTVIALFHRSGTLLFDVLLLLLGVFSSDCLKIR